MLLNSSMAKSAGMALKMSHIVEHLEVVYESGIAHIMDFVESVSFLTITGCRTTIGSWHYPGRIHSISCSVHVCLFPERCQL